MPPKGPRGPKGPKGPTLRRRPVPEVTAKYDRENIEADIDSYVEIGQEIPELIALLEKKLDELRLI